MNKILEGVLKILAIVVSVVVSIVLIVIFIQIVLPIILIALVLFVLSFLIYIILPESAKSRVHKFFLKLFAGKEAAKVFDSFDNLEKDLYEENKKDTEEKYNDEKYIVIDDDPKRND